MNKSVLMFKILNNHSAPNLKDKFITRDTNLSNYNLRNADINLSVPKLRTEYFKKSFGYSGAVLWNSSPTQAKQTESLSSFKNLIKKCMQQSQTSNSLGFLTFFMYVFVILCYPISYLIYISF